MHLAAAKLLAAKIPLRDARRFDFGSILPDAEDGDHGSETHFKVITPDGEKYFDFGRFGREYRREILSDDLYLGYYLHLVADAVYRRFVYEKHGWDPSVPGNVGRLHNDYRLTNGYAAKRYGLEYDIVIPADFSKARIAGEMPFTVAGFFDEMKGDFLPYDGGEPFFLTPEMADDYIAETVTVCEAEYSALIAGKEPVFSYRWK